MAWLSTVASSRHFDYSYAHTYWVNTGYLLFKSPSRLFSFFSILLCKQQITQRAAFTQYTVLCAKTLLILAFVNISCGRIPFRVGNKINVIYVLKKYKSNKIINQ